MPIDAFNLVTGAIVVPGPPDDAKSALVVQEVVARDADAEQVVARVVEVELEAGLTPPRLVLFHYCDRLALLGLVSQVDDSDQVESYAAEALRSLRD